MYLYGLSCLLFFMLFKVVVEVVKVVVEVVVEVFYDYNFIYPFSKIFFQKFKKMIKNFRTISLRLTISCECVLKHNIFLNYFYKNKNPLGIIPSGFLLICYK